MKNQKVKLNELTGISQIKKFAKNNNNLSNGLNNTREFLKKHGWENIGTGTNGVVFAHKKHPNIVLKVFNATDHCYVKFLKLISNHQSNPHFPKIKGKLLKINDRLYAVRLEKLQFKTQHTREKDLLINWVPDLEDSPTYFKSLIEQGYSESLVDAMKILANFILHNGICAYDMHEENIMYRGDELVIIDPVIY